MRIVIASMGRAHLLDCARELQTQGHQVKFYSATPRKNFSVFGLKQGGHSLLFLAFPFYLLQRYIPSNLTRRIYSYMLDLYVTILLPECDVFIAQSPNYQNAIFKAKKKYNAITILDRGSSHVRTFSRLRLLYGEKALVDSYQKRDEFE